MQLKPGHGQEGFGAQGGTTVRSDDQLGSNDHEHNAD
jgi:hypothetical protein